MANINQIRRYFIITRLVIQSKNGIDKKTLLHKVNKDLEDPIFTITERTLDRDIEKIEELFSLTFKKDGRNYVLDFESSTAVKRFEFDILKMYTSLGKLTHIDDYIYPAPVQSDDKIADLFTRLIKALRESSSVIVDYRNFWNNWQREQNNLKLFPLGLKEFERRWYLVAQDETGRIATFALDRIIQLYVHPEEKHSFKLDLDDLFNDVIGIFLDLDCPVEEVVLKLSPKQGKYLKTTPLHHSQTVLVDTDTECQIQLFVRCTYDLEMKILAIGEQVEVLKPELLRNQIKNRLKETLDLYL